jgi:hypothetical protein
MAGIRSRRIDLLEVIRVACEGAWNNGGEA